MTPLRAAAHARVSSTDALSPAAKGMLADLMALPPEIRRDIIRGLTETDMRVLLAAAQQGMGTPYGLWVDDAEGFITDVVGESLWSTPRQIMRAIVTEPKVAVPSCFSSSKTHTSSRAALWWSCVHPAGTARVVTVAPRWRQVIGLIWPEIRRAHSRARLPGVADMAQLKITTADGVDFVVADGLSASPRNEDATQGIHAAHVLVIVDEAGGISPVIGKNLVAMLTGAHTRLLAIGNPPADNEGSWFEEFCASDSVLTIPIPAHSTPAFTGEAVGRCRSCPSEVPPHPVSVHLVQPKDVRDMIADHGESSPYVQAKVYAHFPKGGSNRILPSGWVDLARDSADPEPEDGLVRLCDLDVKEETAEHVVARGAWIRLGVDVAADGGDELVIARQVGDLGNVQHFSSGAENANATDVAGKVLVEIRKAEALRAALGTTARVRVKVDGNGVGWGVVSTLTAWGTEGIHSAEIVGVMVSESTDREPDGSSMVPALKRDEMWIAARQLLQPGRDGESRVRLRIDKKTVAQLVGPRYETTSGGKTRVESKKSMKARGLSSPDRAEAWLLAVYEPAPPKRKRPKVRVMQ